MVKINKIVVFNETVDLGEDIEASEVRANLVSLVGDFNPELSERLANTEDYEVRTEEDSLVVYRHFG